MKIIDLPVRVFETGDKVATGEGSGIVIHDELEGIEMIIDSKEELIEHMRGRMGVIVRLDAPNTKHSEDHAEIVCSRDSLMLLPESDSKNLDEELLY